MYSTNFLVAVAERAIKTFAQTLLATVGADAAGVFTASTLDAVTVAAGAALISVLTSFASASTSGLALGVLGAFELLTMERRSSFFSLEILDCRAST